MTQFPDERHIIKLNYCITCVDGTYNASRRFLRCDVDVQRSHGHVLGVAAAAMAGVCEFRRRTRLRLSSSALHSRGIRSTTGNCALEASQRLLVDSYEFFTEVGATAGAVLWSGFIIDAALYDFMRLPAQQICLMPILNTKQFTWACDQ